VQHAKACRGRIRSVQLFLIIIFPVLFGGCGGGHYSDFSLQFGLGQPTYVQIPPGKSVTVRLAIGFIEGSPGDIRVSWGVPPIGVSVTPSSVTFTTTGEQSVQFAAAHNAPNTSAPMPLTISGIAGSITHSITLYIAVAPEQKQATSAGWNPGYGRRDDTPAGPNGLG
jgi:hypothetical protein